MAQAVHTSEHAKKLAAADFKRVAASLLTQTATESVSFVRADEILSAFVELQRAIHEFAVSLVL